MPKREYLLALVCYLAIPVVLIAGSALSGLIDPEMARGHAHYVRDYRLLDLVRHGAVLATAGLTLALWVSCCCFVLKSRGRSSVWLALSVGGPLGFAVIAALRDRAPGPDDFHQRFLGGMKTYWRVPLEIAGFVAVWSLAYALVVLKRNLMISFQSAMTGTPVATIVAQQNASSGMWAFGEMMQEAYLVILIYLLWPVVFNLVGRRLVGHSKQVAPHLP